jgi:vacuolar-type H+-ATPase subunit H
MKKIVEAEKESGQILDEANREVSEMRRDVPKKITSIRQQILQEAADQREKALGEAERAGAEEAERIASDAQRQVESLSQISRTRRKEAVDRAIALLLS